MGTAEKVKDWWAVADRTQRFVTMFGAAALVVLVVLTAIVASRPKMQAIGGGADLAEKSAIVTALTSEGITVDYDSSGNIRVPQKDVARAQMVLAVAQISLSSPAGSGFAEMGVFTPQAVETAQLRAMKESDLSRTIAMLNGVKSAIVHISPGDKSPFSNEKQPATASVSIVESSEGALSRSQGKAIARIVQNSVKGMTPESVSVITSYGQVLYDGYEANSTDSLAVKKIEVEIAESTRREHDLQRKLDQAFGSGNTIASVYVEISMDTVDIRETETIPNEPVVIGNLLEKLTGASGAGATGGVAGAASNIGAPSSVGGSGGEPAGEFISEKIENQVSYNTKDTKTTKAAGNITAMSVQIIANSTAIEDVKPIEAIAMGFLGDNQGTPGFTSGVTAIEFDTRAIKAGEEAISTAQSAELRQQIISIVPVFALVIVGFLVLRAIGKLVNKQRVVYAALPGGGDMALPAGVATGGPGAVVSPGVEQTPGSQQGGRSKDSVEGGAGQQLTSAIEAGNAAEALRIIEQAPDDPEVLAIKQRVDVPLEQIKHMAKTKPETVAMLLKGWMMEDMR